MTDDEQQRNPGPAPAPFGGWVTFDPLKPPSPRDAPVVLAIVSGVLLALLVILAVVLALR